MGGGGQHDCVRQITSIRGDAQCKACVSQPYESVPGCVQLLVEFKPDDKALELYENFQGGREPRSLSPAHVHCNGRNIVIIFPNMTAWHVADVLIVHAPGAIIEVPIKACKDCEIGSTLLRSTDLDLEFCPSTEVIVLALALQIAHIDTRRHCCLVTDWVHHH